MNEPPSDSPRAVPERIEEEMSREVARTLVSEFPARARAQAAMATVCGVALGAVVAGIGLLVCAIFGVSDWRWALGAGGIAGGYEALHVLRWSKVRALDQAQS